MLPRSCKCAGGWEYRSPAITTGGLGAKRHGAAAGIAEDQDPCALRGQRRHIRVPAHARRPGPRRRAGGRGAGPPAHARAGPGRQPAGAVAAADDPAGRRRAGRGGSFPSGRAVRRRTGTAVEVEVGVAVKVDKAAIVTAGNAEHRQRPARRVEITGRREPGGNRDPQPAQARRCLGDPLPVKMAGCLVQCVQHRWGGRPLGQVGEVTPLPGARSRPAGAAGASRTNRRGWRARRPCWTTSAGPAPCPSRRRG
jgi:hypothetical protein